MSDLDGDRPERRRDPIDPRLHALTNDLGRLLIESGQRLDRMAGLADDVAALREQVASLNASVQLLVPREELEQYPDLNKTLTLLNQSAAENREGIAQAKADLGRQRLWAIVGLVVFFLVTLYGGLTLSDWRTSTCYPAKDTPSARTCDDLFPLAPDHQTADQARDSFIGRLGADPIKLKVALCAGGIALPEVCRDAGLPFGPTTTTTGAP